MHVPKDIQNLNRALSMWKKGKKRKRKGKAISEIIYLKTFSKIHSKTRKRDKGRKNIKKKKHFQILFVSTKAYER